MSPERFGTALGHGAFAIFTRAAGLAFRAAIVVAPSVPILIVLGIFDPGSPIGSRCWCALAISIGTGLYWSGIALCADRARLGPARRRQSKTSV